VKLEQQLRMLGHTPNAWRTSDTIWICIIWNDPSLKVRPLVLVELATTVQKEAYVKWEIYVNGRVKGKSIWGLCKQSVSLTLTLTPLLEPWPSLLLRLLNHQNRAQPPVRTRITLWIPSSLYFRHVNLFAQPQHPSDMIQVEDVLFRVPTHALVSESSVFSTLFMLNKPKAEGASANSPIELPTDFKALLRFLYPLKCVYHYLSWSHNQPNPWCQAFGRSPGSDKGRMDIHFEVGYGVAFSECKNSGSASTTSIRRNRETEVMIHALQPILNSLFLQSGVVSWEF